MIELEKYESSDGIAAREFKRLRNIIRTLEHEMACTRGLWATDLVDLIKDHPRKDLFFRIGYPKEKL